MTRGSRAAVFSAACMSDAFSDQHGLSGLTAATKTRDRFVSCLKVVGGQDTILSYEDAPQARRSYERRL